MNATNLAEKAYAAPGLFTRSARGIEFEAFARVTRRLNATRHMTGVGFSSLAAALEENRRLWVTLAADVADGGNRLPQMLRAQIFYLAEFTQHHTRKVLSGRADPEVLVEINTAVMRGLRDRGGAAP